VKKGIVYIVGAGPGDFDLITLKALKCISSSDVIIYDHLVNKKLLFFTKTDAELIYAGKKAKHHTLSQDEINKLMVKKAKEGKVVTRLKGGDPFIFGRGGEEAEFLKENGINFQIVPGISSAIASAEYAGIPLTHRKYSSTLAFVTGHEDPKKAESNICWKSLCNIGTLVILMGLGNIEKIVETLINSGKDPKTKVAVIRWATTPKQKVIEGTLEDIVDKVKKANFTPPVIIIIGEVVRLREKIKWFENLPLFGRTIVITRQKEKILEFSQKLMSLGAEVIEFPTIQIKEIKDQNEDEIFSNIKEYSWMIFTSANGVKIFMKKLFEKNLDVRFISHLKFATIGEKTKEELKKFGIIADLVPKEFKAENLAESLKERLNPLDKILIVRAKKARDVLEKNLKEVVKKVDIFSIYETVIPKYDDLSWIEEKFENKEIDAIVFSSPSTFLNFKEIFKEKTNNFLSNVDIFAIGPITAKTIETHGISVSAVSDKYTEDGIISKILSFYH